MKKSFLLLAFLSISIFTFDVSCIYSQQPTQEWVSRWPSSSPLSSWGKSIKSDSQGFIYVLADTGFGFGFLKYDQNGNLLLRAHNWPGGPYNGGAGAYFDVASNGDVYITGSLYIDLDEWIYTVKFNSNGVFQWGKIYNSDNEDQSNDIALDNSGNVIVVGATANGGYTGYALTIKYNSNGDTLWTMHFNNSPTDAENTKVVLDNLNNIYTTGDVTFVGRCLVTKYDPNGNLLWFQTFTFDSLRSNLAVGINIDQSGNLYVIGTQVTPPPLPYNSFIVKFNNNGNVVWSAAYPGYATGGENLWGPVISDDGNAIYYVTSAEDTVGTTGENIKTIKYNSSGSLEWYRAYNGRLLNSMNLPRGIKLDKYQNIYVCGTAQYQATGNDFVILKYLPNGILSWSTDYSGIVINGGDGANDLYIDTSLNVYATGSSRKSINSNIDAVTIKYSQPIGIISNGNQMPHVYELNQNYPNPFNSSTIISYELPKRSGVQLKIFNSVGQLVKTLVNTEQDASYYSILLNADDFASGVYFYQLQAGTYSESRKMLLIK